MRLVSLLLLVVLSPILLIVSICVFIDLGFPIFYKDRRLGHQFCPFNLLKFRTMIDADGPRITVGRDLRITSFGRFLRTFRIDELPQLVNIIRGQMNFVGPRPESVTIAEDNPSSFTYLEYIKPGVTDISSIIFKDEAQILSKHSDSLEYYFNEILPIKASISESYKMDLRLWSRFVIVIATLVSFVSYDLALKISRTVFYIDDSQFCDKLNNLIGKEIF